MTKTHRRRSRLLALAVVAAAAFACRDAASLAGKDSVAPRLLTPRVVVGKDGNAVTLTIAIDAPSTDAKFGSVTGRLRFDPTALVFEGEQMVNDGVLRAMNPSEPGVVRFAAASATGMDAAQLVALRFRAQRADDVGALQVQIEELHDVARVNRTAAVRGATLVEARP